MKLFTTKQIATLDRYTIENEPISDIDLMERAALQISDWLVKNLSSEHKLIFFAGPGNNGGDALAIARQLAELDFICEVFLFTSGRTLSESAATNFDRLQKQGKVKTSVLKHLSDFPETNPTDVFIDGLFGSGLTRPLEGFAAELVQKINKLPNKVIAIDIPSGLPGENSAECDENNTIKACHTLTFQFPKLSFLFAENEKFTGKWEVLPIRLHPEGIAVTPSDYFWIDKPMVQQMIQPRSKFGHKGNYGHALLIAGSYGKMGAAILASRACLRTGAGLLTTHVPHFGYTIIQTSVPEAMASVDQHDSIFTEFPELSQFTAIGAGPGIDKKTNTRRALAALISQSKAPLVLDADALNILAETPDLIEKLPENTILTPHPGEFRRLVGETGNSWERLQRQVEFSKKYKLIVVLKGAFTSVVTPDGQIYFNSTGNPGMATAGSGDVLTGIILGFLAQGFSPENAAIAGVYLHGRAGDLAAQSESEYSLIAGDVVGTLGAAFQDINQPLEK